MAALPGFDAWICGKEDLILSKPIRAKDSGSEMQRRDIRNLLDSGADLDHIRSFAPRLGVSTGLEGILDEGHDA